MADSNDNAGNWRLRVSRKPEPNCPRETLVLTMTASHRGFRVVTRDVLGHRHGGVGRTPADAVARTVRNIVNGFGPMVWAVAPPGEELPADGRPEAVAREEPSRFDLPSLALAESGGADPDASGAIARLGLSNEPMDPTPKPVIALARKTILAGASAHATRIHGYNGGRGFCTVTVRGIAAVQFSEELRALGFKRSGSTARWTWSPQ